MIVLKMRNSWSYVRTMPLIRALLLDGAIYYFAFVLAFGLEVVANVISEVGDLHLYHS